MFGEFFHSDFNDFDEHATLTVEVFSSKAISDLFLGACSLDLTKLPPEQLHDVWLPLATEAPINRRLSKASLRSTQALGATNGKIHLRLVLSNHTGLRPRRQLALAYDYQYESCAFKTGDVVAFSGIGLLSSLTKLRCGVNYSQVGIILVLPNLYTNRPELYVAEVTSNHDGMVRDVWRNVVAVVVSCCFANLTVFAHFAD